MEMQSQDQGHHDQVAHPTTPLDGLYYMLISDTFGCQYPSDLVALRWRCVELVNGVTLTALERKMTMF